MTRPDYSGGGIANLIASIAAACGDTPALPTLHALPPAEIAAHRNVILFVIDGLGHEWLLRQGKGILARHLRAGITSVFPSTTAAAIPTFLTGLPPAAHGITGWHMYLRELGCALAVFPGRPRFGGASYAKAGIDVRALYGNTPIFDRLAVRSHVVAPKAIARSDFNRAHLGRARLHTFVTLDGMFDAVTGVVRGARDRNYVYAYWPELDSLGHEHGIGSPAAYGHLEHIEVGFAAFLDGLSGSDTLVVVTADHGMIDAHEVIDLDDHPAIADDLALPLCGEPRAAICHLRTGRERGFEQRVRETFGDAVTVHRSTDLLRDGWFGPGTPHPRLEQRIGDYILIPNGNRIVRDHVLGEDPPKLIGAHGGITSAEMNVPLIVAGC